MRSHQQGRTRSGRRPATTGEPRAAAETGAAVAAHPGERRGAAGADGARTPAGASTPRALYWRRRAVVVLGLLVVVFLLAALIGRVGAGAQLEDEVAGHAVVEPGETLWDIAAATAPAGVDTREHLEALRELNGLSGSRVEAWTVVLVPAR